MQRLEVSGAVRPIYGSLGFKRLLLLNNYLHYHHQKHHTVASLKVHKSHPDTQSTAKKKLITSASPPAKAVAPYQDSFLATESDLTPRHTKGCPFELNNLSDFLQSLNIFPELI